MEGEPLHIQADSSDASAKGVAIILEPIVETLKDLDNNKRYSFELEIEEHE